MTLLNCRFKDDDRMTFRKPTRLECMMQDIGKNISRCGSVGFTTTSTWLGYSPAKNSIPEGLKKLKSGLSPMVPGTAEQDMFNVVAEMLRRHGCDIGMPVARVFGSVSLKFGPLISIEPHYFLWKSHLAHVFPSPNNIHISSRSTLVVKGKGTLQIDSLRLDGGLVIELSVGTHLRIVDVEVVNDGSEMTPLSDEFKYSEVHQIRGYQYQEHEMARVSISEPGTFVALRQSCSTSLITFRVRTQQEYLIMASRIAFVILFAGILVRNTAFP